MQSTWLLSVRSAVRQIRNRGKIIVLTVLFLFGLVTSKLSILNFPNERQIVHTRLVGHKRELKLLQAGEPEQSLMPVLLSYLASHCGAAFCDEAGKYHPFGLARVCIASGDRKRQLCELNKVVLTCRPIAIRMIMAPLQH